MATLVQKVNDLSAAIGLMLKNSVMTRLLPVGGEIGQIPMRTANGFVWVDMPTGTGGTDPGQTLEAETTAYVERVAAAGAPFDTATVTAVDTWVKALKAANAWDSIKDCSLMLGTNLASALVKIKYPNGTAGTVVSQGMTDAHYTPAGGIGWYEGENSNQGLDTAVAIAQLGVSGSNLSMGFMRLDYSNEPRYWMADSLAAGEEEAPAYISDYNPGTKSKVGLTGNGPSLRVTSTTTDARTLVVENGAVVNPFSGADGGTSVDLGDGSFTIFHTRRFNVDFWATLRTGFYFIGTALTTQQAIAVSRATRALYKTVGRIVMKTECAYIGDSITAGFFVSNPNDRWSTLSSVALNRWETNFGVPSSSIRVKNDNAESLIQRYQDIIATGPDEYSVMMGSNDVLTDQEADGTPSIIADCKAKMLTVLTALKATGKSIRWNGFPFTPNITETKAAAYEAAFGDVARQLGIPYCSQYLRMQDTGNPGSLLGGDGVHPNQEGMAFLAAGDVELATSKTSRAVTLSFPSVDAAGTQDLYVTMYGAAAGDLVTVTPPASFPAGLTVAATVTANDTVRVRVSNATDAAVVPAAGVFAVLLSPLETEVGGGEGSGPDNDTVALLHFNEGNLDSPVPEKIPNYAESELTFSNKANVSGLGGRYWSTGPFGTGLRAEAANGSTMAVVCEQLITVEPGVTHEAFFTEGLDSGRVIWSLSKNGTDSSDHFMRLIPYDNGGGNWSIALELKLPGIDSVEACETSLFVPNTGDMPNWIVTQWRTDGFVEVWVNGDRLAVSDVAHVGVMADTVLCMFGSYNPVNNAAGGMWRVVMGEMRFSKKQRYSGTSVPVPTVRYTSTTTGGGGAETTNDIVDSSGTVSPTSYADIAQNYASPTKGILYRFGAPATRTDAPTLAERPDTGTINYENGAQMRYQFGTQNDVLHNEFVSNHGSAVLVPDGDKTVVNSVTRYNSYSIDRRTITQRPQLMWQNRTLVPQQVTDYIAGDSTYNSATLDPARPEDMAVVQTRWVGPSDSGADRQSLVATQGSATRGAFVFCVGTETAHQRGIVQLAPGMAPTAIEVSPGGEFAFVTLWDYVNFKGKVAVISLGSVPMYRTWQNVDDWYDWWSDFSDMTHPGLKNKGGWCFLKVLGYIELSNDMKAPTSVYVLTGVNPQEFIYDAEGNPTNMGKECSPLEANRDRLLDQNDMGRFIPKGGLLVVGSKSEKRFKLYDLAPLYEYTNDMYFGSLAKNVETQLYQLNGAGAPAAGLGVNGKRYLNNTNGDVYLKTNGVWAVTHNIGTKRGLGMGANQWPYPFSTAPQAMPVFVKGFTLPDNIIGFRAPVTYNYWSKDNMRRTPGTPYFQPAPRYPRLWVATTNGKVYIYEVGRWVPGTKVADQAPQESEINQIGVVSGLGDQITHIAGVRDFDIDLKGVEWDPNDDLPDPLDEMALLVDRKNRRLVWIQFTPTTGDSAEIVTTLEDSRMDPITAEHIEPYHVSNKVVTIADYTGKAVKNYRVMTAKPLTWDSLGGQPVTYPTLSPSGEFAGELIQPGKPFQVCTSNAP